VRIEPNRGEESACKIVEGDRGEDRVVRERAGRAPVGIGPCDDLLADPRQLADRIVE
jgi:hypothetical protein